MIARVLKSFAPPFEDFCHVAAWVAMCEFEKGFAGGDLPGYCPAMT